MRDIFMKVKPWCSMLPMSMDNLVNVNLWYHPSIPQVLCIQFLMCNLFIYWTVKFSHILFPYLVHYLSFLLSPPYLLSSFILFICLISLLLFVIICIIDKNSHLPTQPYFYINTYYFSCNALWFNLNPNPTIIK